MVLLCLSDGVCKSRSSGKEGTVEDGCKLHGGSDGYCDMRKKFLRTVVAD